MWCNIWVPQGSSVGDNTIVGSSAALCHTAWSVGWLEQWKLPSWKSSPHRAQQSHKQWCSLVIVSEQNTAAGQFKACAVTQFNALLHYLLKNISQIFLLFIIKCGLWVTEMVARRPVTKFGLIFSGNRSTEVNNLYENCRRNCSFWS